MYRHVKMIIIVVIQYYHLKCLNATDIKAELDISDNTLGESAPSFKQPNIRNI